MVYFDKNKKKLSCSVNKKNNKILQFRAVNVKLN